MVRIIIREGQDVNEQT
jgi:ankyrin repeat protein